MNWRLFALAMTAACGGELACTGYYLGGALLLVFAIVLAAVTHKWVRV